MSCQMRYEYNEELDKDVLHLPLFQFISGNIINMKGVNYGGNNYNSLRYADVDKALLAGNEKELSELMGKVNKIGK